MFGFKCFLLHSGVDEFPPLDADEMEEAMRELSKFDAMLIVHAEDSRAISRAPQPWGDQYERFLHSLPRGAENLAIAEVIERARHRELLWEGLVDGTIDCVVSDHSPSTLDLKDLENGDFSVAWGGISSLQLGLSLMWTEGRRRGISLEQVLGWMSEKPARLAGLLHKGRITQGYDATSRSSPTTTRSSSTWRSCTTRTRSRRTRAARWPAWCVARSCAARRSTARTRAGSCSPAASSADAA
ncbi:hypothetical protein GCM10025789_05520 [Tessaracoccus lubricantis]|uniref:Amidohydrolase-related domain-containing protein n=1 Tax=Tessaracoccus lubricantis TaxID=545543 RepID=A0ABP9F0Z2_9ACTN